MCPLVVGVPLLYPYRERDEEQECDEHGLGEQDEEDRPSSQQSDSVAHPVEPVDRKRAD